MSKKIVIIIAIILIGSIVYSVGVYNSLVNKDEDVKTAWGQVENQYQRRSDLIPNLVNTVKGYTKHEKETLESIIEARAKATQTKIDPSNLDANALQNFQQVQGALSSALSKLMVVVEKYPDLKANQNFLTLQAQLEGTENRIAYERKRFNDNSKAYNKYLRRFPNKMFADMFGFEAKDYFQAEEGAEKVIDVEF